MLGQVPGTTANVYWALSVPSTGIGTFMCSALLHPTALTDPGSSTLQLTLSCFHSQFPGLPRGQQTESSDLAFLLKLLGFSPYRTGPQASRCSNFPRPLGCCFATKAPGSHYAGAPAIFLPLEATVLTLIPNFYNHSLN